MTDKRDFGGEPVARRLVAEGLGTAFLLATVVGSGIMGERLADGNVALALLGIGQAAMRSAEVVVDVVQLGHARDAERRRRVTDRVLEQELRPARAVELACPIR